MLEQSYFLDASKVNRAVAYPDVFVVSSPFGVERLYAVAFTEKPAPLPLATVTLGQSFTTWWWTSRRW